MSYWIDMYMRHEQMIDRRQEAASYRLVNPKYTATQEQSTIFEQLMASAGRQLITWGYRLEAHHN